MRIEAQVNEKWKFPTLTCFGLGFNKVDWVLVPVAGEEEVKNNPYLDIRPIEPEVLPEPEIEEPAEPEEEEPLASKAVKEHAAELGVDLNHVEGTGKEGRITKGDVNAFVDSLEPEIEEPAEPEEE